MSGSSDIINLQESLTGFLSSNPDLLHLNQYGVIARDDEEFKTRKIVKLISGGGSGHEPAHLGFVGVNLLSAAVCGEVFTSPSPQSILAAIFNVGDTSRGILVIIKNYTGDRLNFGLACEIARNQHNINVKMLIVNDDCAIDDDHVRKSVGKRGLCGVVLIHKIAGAMAADGKSLDEIYDFCNELLEQKLLRTIGFSFHVSQYNQIVDIEIGKGIHQEPGVLKLDGELNFLAIVDILAGKLKLKGVNEEVAIVFNNLGGASEFIFSYFIKQFMGKCSSLEINIKKFYAGRFLTSLNQEGISVTVLELKNKDCLKYLEKVVIAPSASLFNECKPINSSKVSTYEVPDLPPSTSSQNSAVKATKFQSEASKKALQFICEALISCRPMLNKMDSEYGDGDCGNTLGRGAEKLRSELIANKLDLENTQFLLHQISDSLQNSMGGSSGILYSIFFQCASNAFNGITSITIDTWLKALKLGNQGIQKYGLAMPNDRTMLDALKFGEIEMEGAMKDKKSYIEVLQKFSVGCENGARTTMNMVAKSGRAAYTFSETKTEIKSKFSDPGAHAVGIISKALLEAVKMVAQGFE